MIIDLTLILILGLLGGFTAQKLKQPLIVGYMVAGLCGSVIFSRFISNQEAITAISEIGVALLLFTVGLELNFSHFKKVIKVAVFGAVIQMLFVTILLRIILYFFSVNPTEAFIIAIAFSLSSTALVVKYLSQQGLSETVSGELMIAWLIVQDLAVIPILTVIPLFADSQKGGGLLELLLPIGISCLYLILLYALGKRTVPKILGKIAKTNSNELLLLTVVVLCLIISLLTKAIGLPFSIGAFLAGLFVSEAFENHQIFSQIRPLRDLFSLVFFVSLSFLIDISSLGGLIPLLIILSIAVICIKIIVTYLCALSIGVHQKIAYITAFGIFQIGEFSFIIAQESLAQRFITTNTYSLILCTTLVTLIVWPIIFKSSYRFYPKVRKSIAFKIPIITNFFHKHGAEYPIMTSGIGFQNHVVLCGFGRMGKYIGRAFEHSNIPYLVIEIDRYLASELKKSGLTVIYGDPSYKEILQMANVQTAKLLIIAIPDTDSQQLIITNARSQNPSLKIISRTHFETDQRLLYELGADAVVHPEFSAALDVVSKSLKLYGFDQTVIDGKISRLKIEHGIT